ncbi:branched-chain amino acid ABC transporter permease [Actinomadura opuntiae]|uniref:branched-chain amino acid ABC transporter permease n=1 Tax=Actinomadura sp. OS1-43 TaxID=604315 RepID=UPI00255B1D23|nr:branched-chain amino acid ABC transporter permease [Actinomadura sp. OS1-43]MDL4812677.1 branched-chain amino acid ABC transporter permease [Actinomadura sp. OS1-43]
MSTGTRTAVRRLLGTRVLVPAAFAAAVVLPFVVQDYTLFQFGRVMCIAIAVMSLDLLSGHAGQVSAGHGALFGLGAYTTVIFIHHLSVPYPLAVVAGVIVCFAVGLLLGLPALRIRGMTLGLVTIAAAILFPAVLKAVPDLTGGVFGLGLQPPGAPLGIPLTSAQWLFLVNLACLAVALVIVQNLVHSRFGHGLEAIRTNENMAVSLGVDVRRSKVLVFALSSGLAGFAGGLYQLGIGTATPDTFTFTLSLTLLFAAIVGGLRSRAGALIGAAFVVFVPDYTAALGDRGPQLINAVALLLVVYLLPGGIARILHRPAEVSARLRHVRSARRPVPTPGSPPG